MDTIIAYFFDSLGNPDVIEKRDLKEEEPGKRQKLRCRSCQHIVTDDTQRISVENGHTHVRTNPSGIEYHFQCFGLAPGCTSFGEATFEYTWFSGYRWQVAVCRGCGEHLGWYFRGDSAFYGLIISRLVSDGDWLN